MSLTKMKRFVNNNTTLKILQIIIPIVSYILIKIIRSNSQWI